jgi:hypothetical protein
VLFVRSFTFASQLGASAKEDLLEITLPELMKAGGKTIPCKKLIKFVFGALRACDSAN